MSEPTPTNHNRQCIAISVYVGSRAYKNRKVRIQARFLYSLLYYYYHHRIILTSNSFAAGLLLFFIIYYFFARDKYVFCCPDSYLFMVMHKACRCLLSYIYFLYVLAATTTSSITVLYIYDEFKLWKCDEKPFEHARWKTVQSYVDVCAYYIFLNISMVLGRGGRRTYLETASCVKIMNRKGQRTIHNNSYEYFNTHSPRRWKGKWRGRADDLDGKIKGKRKRLRWMDIFINSNKNIGRNLKVRWVVERSWI